MSPVTDILVHRVLGATLLLSCLLLEEKHIWYVPNPSESQDISAGDTCGPAFLEGRKVGQNECSRGSWGLERVKYGFL